MDFVLSKEQEMARTLFKEFAENEVKPLAQEVDETERLRKWLSWALWEFPLPRSMAARAAIPLPM